MNSRIYFLLLSLLLSAAMTFAQVAGSHDQKSSVTEEFHQSVPLAFNGHISLDDLNGSVRITAWDRNELRIDAVKRAGSAEDLAHLKVKVDAAPDCVRIRTEHDSDDAGIRSFHRQAQVDYTITAPRQARFESIELMNGDLSMQNFAGPVRAYLLDGHIACSGLAGEAKLSTINGTIEARFDEVGGGKPVSLNSVNGEIVLVLPSDANVDLKANTMSGAIENDFGLPVNHAHLVGSALAGTIGKGESRFKVNSVSGKIVVHRAQDNRAPSPVKNLLQESQSVPEIPDTQAINQDIKRELERAQRELNLDSVKKALQETEASSQATVEARSEAAEGLRQAQRALSQAQPALDSALKESTEEMRREIEEVTAETRRLTAESLRFPKGVSSNLRHTETETKTFAATGSPRVNIATFDGAITVHGWDRPEVMFKAIKSAESIEELAKIKIQAGQRDREITLTAEPQQDRNSTVEARVEFEVFVPRETNMIHVSSGDGRLSVDGVSSDLDLRTSDGHIEVTGGRGKLRANTGDGALRIAGFEGEADARTGDGKIDLSGRFTRLSAQTGDGSILLQIPADTNATIETHATSVLNEGLAFTEEPAQKGGVHRWKLGQGGNLFILRTGDGSIVMRRAE